MWNDAQSNQFDQGGGYMNSPSNFGSQQGGPKRKFERSFPRPVTIAQVLQAAHEDDRFVSFGADIGQVVVVGIVRSVKETPTRIDYELDDMSGPPIEVRHFVDSEAGPGSMIREDMYVHVMGHLRSFNGKRNIVVINMRPIMDMNEITIHLLEILAGNKHQQKKQSNNNTMNTSTSRASNAMPNNAHSFVAQNNGLTNIQNQVDQCIKNCNNQNGCSITDIQAMLRGVPQREIKDAVEFLSTEGHIYSTIDDEHFKSTDSM